MCIGSVIATCHSITACALHEHHWLNYVKSHVIRMYAELVILSLVAQSWGMFDCFLATRRVGSMSEVAI
jgi:hypothetical protein